MSGTLSPGRVRAFGSRIVTPLRQTDPVRASDADPTTYDFTAQLYEWTGPAAWHFVTVPVAISDEIDARTHGLTNGIGSVTVRLELAPLT